MTLRGTLALLFLTAAPLAALAQQAQYKSENVAATAVPGNITADFKTRFPGATLVNWRKVSWGAAYAYEVGFVYNTALCNARFWSDGNFRWSNEVYIGKAMAKVPQVKAAAEKLNAGWQAEGVKKGIVNWGEAHTYWEITLKRGAGEKLKIFLNDKLESISESTAAPINDKAQN